MRRNRLLATTGVVAPLMAAVLIAGCGGSSATKSATKHCKTMKMADGEVMCASAMKSGSTTSTSGDPTKGSTKDLVQVDTKVPEVNGQKPVPMTIIADSYWQGMKIQAQTMTPIPFVIYNGTKARMVRPQKDASFHLMVVLDGAKTGKPIPYGQVWATVQNSKGKVFFNDTLWRMLSAFIGPHYGNDVKHLPAGRYKLTALITPPTGARTGAYADVWTTTHTVVDYFTWNGHKVTSGSKMAAGSMDSMTMTSGDTEVNGHKKLVTKTFGTSYWQGMKIIGTTAKPQSYYYFTTVVSTLKRKHVTPASGSSVYLMETLEDSHTFEPIPYSTVTATVIDSSGKTVAHTQLVHTVSAFDEPFYGQNVKLPKPGRYKVLIHIGAPVAARHKEYWHVWLHAHTVVQYLDWSGK